MYLDRCPLSPTCDYEVKLYRYLNVGDPTPPHWHEDGVLMRLERLATHMRESHGAKTPAERMAEELETERIKKSWGGT